MSKRFVNDQAQQLNYQINQYPKKSLIVIVASHIHWVDRGIGTPKDRGEVNRREVCECDGWVCDLEVIDVPSRLRLIRKAAVLTGQKKHMLSLMPPNILCCPKKSCP